MMFVFLSNGLHWSPDRQLKNGMLYSAHLVQSSQNLCARMTEILVAPSATCQPPSLIQPWYELLHSQEFQETLPPTLMSRSQEFTCLRLVVHL